MRRIWILLGVALLAGSLALAAVGCGDDDDAGNGDGGPTVVQTSEPEPTQPDGAEPTAPDGAEPTEPDGPGGDFTTLVVTDGALTTFDGYSLYTFDNDAAGVSNCIDACASTWPPLPTNVEPTGGEGVTGTLGTIDRPDGLMQVTYNDQPLYFNSADTNPGDANGDGVGGIWHIATP